MKSSAKRGHNKGFLGVRAEQISTWPFVPENLTWSLEWGQRGANLPAPTMERQPSSVTHSHSQTSFMCKSSLDPLFTPCAFQILAESSDICNDGAADMLDMSEVVVVVVVGCCDNKAANMFVRQKPRPNSHILCKTLVQSLCLVRTISLHFTRTTTIAIVYQYNMQQDTTISTHDSIVIVVEQVPGYDA